MHRIFVILILFVAVSCSHQRALQKQYVGKPVSVLSEKYGYPKVVLDQKNEKIYVYEIVKELKSTTINQGKLSLDPIVSPSVEKTERYYFTVKNDIIVSAKIEEEYER
jgi:hypothetical protein